MIEDATGHPEAEAVALKAPAMQSLGFRPLGLVRWAFARDEREHEVVVQVYVARYGDAIALVDATDPRLRLRVVSVLQSGRLVETLVPERRRAPGAPVDITLARPADGDATPMNPLAWIDGIEERLSRARLPLRFPDLARIGVHRQLVLQDDPETIWVAHRGLLRRVQGADDDVADHQTMALVCAALRRAEHVHDAVETNLARLVWTAANALRNVLLVVPGLLVLSSGITWWMAGLAVGCAASGALLTREAVAEPTWRPFLLAVPVVLGFVGFLTVGWAPLTVMWIWGVAVVYARDVVLTGIVTHALKAAGDITRPEPVPLPQMLEAYR